MFDDFQKEQEPITAPAKRTPGLTVVCILTFIFSGILLFSSSLNSIFYYYLPEYYRFSIEFFKSSPLFKGAVDTDAMAEVMKVMINVSIWFYILNALLYGLSLTGAILMFRLRKIGFHFYTVAQILLLIVPLAFLTGYKTDFTSIFTTTVFILIYASNLRLMK